MITKLSDLYNHIDKQIKKKKLVVAVAQEEHVLEAVAEAKRKNIVDLILVGHEKKIKEILERKELPLSDVEIINEENIKNAAIASVKIIYAGDGDILMKGNIDSSGFLRAVLDKQYGLRKQDILSHVGIIELPNYHKIFALTDGAFNIAPDLNMKISILHNTISFVRKLGIKQPKVAVLGVFERVHPKMQATMDAAILSKMSQRGQIRQCIIDGPLSFDNAISKQSANFKGIDNEVAGDADILLLPNLDRFSF
jgi:phosphate butyryltransferase